MNKIFLTAIFLLLIFQIAFVCAYPENFDGWRVMPIRSEKEFEQEKIGGEAEQHNHGIARSPSNPNTIYLAHDIGAVWRSTNAGESWQKTLGKSLWLQFGESIEVDPVDPDTIFLIVSNSYNYKSIAYAGIYRSKDSGDNFEFVLPTTVKWQRFYTHNLAYDLTSITSSNATRWYAGFSNNGLYRSEDSGNTWTKVSDLSTHDTVYSVQTHPSDGQTVYLASNLGFFKSSNKGANLQKTGTGLPSGEVSSIAINPQNPQMIYVTVRTNGLYRSTDGGNNFSLLKSFDAERVFINPGYPDVIYLVGISTNTIISHDAGAHWITDMCTQPAPGLARDAPTCGKGWKGMIAGGATGIVPNPNDSNEAVAFSRGTVWKTTDGGHLFKDSSTLWTGFAWGWAMGGTAFDAQNPNKFAFFLCDVTSVLTMNGGDFFEQKGANEAWTWKGQGIIDWVNMLAGDFQPGNSNVIVSSVGDYFANILTRSTDNGKTWQIADRKLENHYFVAFHPNDPNIVYAGSARSTNAGQTFTHIAYLETNKALMVGMCLANPDIVYAFSRDNKTIYRSDDRAMNWKIYTKPGWSLNLHDSLPTFAADPFNCNKIYTVASNGDLASFDGTTWKSMGVLALTNTPAGLSNFARNVTLDPKKEGIIYVSMFASGPPNIFRSIDGGNIWEDISYNRPRIDAGLSVNPHTGELFAGSGFGTWVLPPPYESANLFYDKLFSMPSCQDGLKNGSEEGVDCGGSCKAPCRTCSADPQCLAGEKCCAGYCKKPACAINEDCGTGRQCTNGGQCSAACQNINCPEGAINTACYCGGLPKTGGYCCSGTYRATVCSTDTNCNDNNIATKDTCTSPKSCTAACTHTTITQCINNDGYCPPTCTSATDNDCLASCGNGVVNSGENCSNCPQDVNCSSAQTCCAGVCITPECSTDANCSSGQHCTSNDPCTGQCTDCNITCTTNTQCNDNNPDTNDSCENASTCESYCKNEPLTCGGIVCQTAQICCNELCTTPACTKTSDCNDSDVCTRDSCKTAGTCTAQCSHTAIPKCGWKKMNWTIPSCFPIAALFTVTLKDETGTPLEGVEITYGTQKMLTNAEGKVEMLGEKAKYVINATKEGYYPLTARKLASTTCKPTYTTTGTKPVPVTKGKIEIEVLETPYINREFTIKITDNNSKAVQEATITYSQQTTETNEQGQATLTAEKSKYLITATSAQGTASTRILPKTFTQPDQNTGTGAGTAKPFTIPLDIIVLAAVIVIGVIVLLRARATKKETAQT